MEIEGLMTERSLLGRDDYVASRQRTQDEIDHAMKEMHLVYPKKNLMQGMMMMLMSSLILRFLK